MNPEELHSRYGLLEDSQAAANGDGVEPDEGPEELEENYVLARRSLILTRDLPAGTVLEADMLTVKRPGSGIPPKDLERVLGRPLRADVEADDVLTWDLV